MGCQSIVELSNNLTFSICTHDPDTGILTDASGNPSYRIYEDETATAILTGTMGKLDDSNTTGFYTEQIACTSGNGFELGKSYTIYIEATVSGNLGGIAFSFTVISLADQVFDEVVEGALKARQILRLLLAALAGKSSGGGTSSVAFRDVADSKNRVSATVDDDGNRTAVTLSGD